eukprot:TRINITY_DN16500_c0_g1_i1.p1 TRINITY_DN16500_c0_g1~~TRINITY_DN16500_c0_g1_i1.p1  ORF type:complete len:396 (+),score=59.32 TRINITY_DN16500_c0_g1_i1:140-1189(+)
MPATILGNDESRGVYLKQTLKLLQEYLAKGKLLSILCTAPDIDLSCIPTSSTVSDTAASTSISTTSTSTTSTSTTSTSTTSTSTSEIVWPRAEFVYLLGRLNKQLHDATTLLSLVCAGRVPMGQNFDVVEMAFRRYLHMLRHMFTFDGVPVDSKPTAASCITDIEARQVWVREVGADRYFTTFPRFYRDVVAPQAKKDECDYRSVMNYMLNFPKDNTVSVAKFDMLVQTFGPYNQLYANIREYVGSRGFLGFVNRIAADEQTVKFPDTVLIRFSRTRPCDLVFSHYDFKKKQRYHLVKPPGKTISDQLAGQFPGKRLIPLKLDDKTVYLTAGTITTYCSGNGGYFSDAH